MKTLIFMIIILGCFTSCKKNLKKVELFYSNGNLKEIYYVDINKREQGIGYTYFQNGNLKEKRIYKDAKSNGKCIFYHSNGRVESISTFKNNIAVDTTFRFGKSGKLESYSIYNASGNVLKEILFYPNGKINFKTAYNIDGSIHAEIKFSPEGKIIEKESNYLMMRYLTQKKDSISLELHNLKFKDSIAVLIVNSLDFPSEYEAIVRRKINFSNTDYLKFKLLDNDFVKGKINIVVEGKKQVTNTHSKVQHYYIQLDKKINLPKDNVEGILKKY